MAEPVDNGGSHIRVPDADTRSDELGKRTREETVAGTALNLEPSSAAMESKDRCLPRRDSPDPRILRVGLPIVPQSAISAWKTRAILSDGFGVERDVYHYGPARFIKGLAWGLTLSLMLWILVAWIVSGLVSQ